MSFWNKMNSLLVNRLPSEMIQSLGYWSNEDDDGGSDGQWQPAQQQTRPLHAEREKALHTRSGPLT